MIDHLVIVAGGKGSRMAAVSSNLPKALVAVGGKPVLQHQLELAASAGITKATIFAGHLADEIIKFVGDGDLFGLRVDVLVEDEPLGNAGAVLANLGRLPQHFILVYGDVMLSVDLAEMARAHLESAADFTTLVHPNDHPLDSDIVETDDNGWVLSVHAYPHPQDSFFANQVNAALYIIKRDSLTPLTNGGKADFTKDVLPKLIKASAKVLAYSTSEYIKDMGTPARLSQVEEDLASGRIATAAAAPAVFLDRDGTLNRDTGFLAHYEGMELLPGVAGALRRLRQLGYRLVVVTNQPVIARGEASEADVAAIHNYLEWELGKNGAFLDAIYFCPHHPDAGFSGERPELKGPCECRKPGTGMVERACVDHRIDLKRSWMIGDQTADMELARRVGLKSVLLRTGAGGQDQKYDVLPHHIVDDLVAAAQLIAAKGAP